MQQQFVEEQVDPGRRAIPDLHRSALHFQHLLENLPVGAYTCNREGLITSYNHHAVQLWGRTPKLLDPIDRFCGSFKLFAPDGSPIAHDQCWMALALQMNKALSGCEVVIERPDGQRITVLAHANPIHDESGNLLGAVNDLVDITAQKLAAMKHTAEARRLHTQSDIAQIALSSLPPEVLMPRLLEAICRAQQYTYGLLWRIVEKGRAAVVVAAFGEGTTPFLGYR